MASRYKAYPEYRDSGVKWIGQVPSDWVIYYGKRIFKNRRELAQPTDEQLAASQKFGVVPQSLMMKLNDSKVMLALKGTSSFRHVEKNDYVISLRSFEGGIEHSDYTGCVSPAYTVLHPLKRVAASYYKHLFKSRPFISALQSTTDSLRDGKSITYEQFGAIPLVLPERSEQKQIAKFLDHETGKIDALIEKQQALIALLKEKRQAVISHAVTKGLNPHATMKDSGVEWLGEVPEHWEVATLKRICEVRDGTHDTPSYVEASSDGAVPLVTSKDFVGDDINFLGAKWISLNDHKEIIKRSLTETGDVLMSMIGGNIGKALIVGERSDFSIKNVALFKTKGDSALAVFILYYLQSGLLDVQISLLSRGGAQGFLGLGDIRNLIVPIGSPSDRESIVLYLDGLVPRFDGLVDQALEQTNLLQERRTALISAAVTGKIDVRSWTAPEEPVQKGEV